MFFGIALSWALQHRFVLERIKRLGLRLGVSFLVLWAPFFFAEVEASFPTAFLKGEGGWVEIEWLEKSDFKSHCFFLLGVSEAIRLGRLWRDASSPLREPCLCGTLGDVLWDKSGVIFEFERRQVLA